MSKKKVNTTVQLVGHHAALHVYIYFVFYSNLLTLNLEIAQFLLKASSTDPSPERKSNQVTYRLLTKQKRKRTWPVSSHLDLTLGQ